MMIGHETALKLQAYLDDELPPDEIRRLTALIESDAGAKALVAELRATRSLLKDNETERLVPESREFYWSNIRRQIERSVAETETGLPTQHPWWIRFIAPASVLAALVLFVTVILTLPDKSDSGAVSLAVGHEIETPLDDITSIAFRSESAGMTVVWVNTRADWD